MKIGRNCECRNMGCGQVIEMSLFEYIFLENNNYIAIAKTHEITPGETIIKDEGNYWVVEERHNP